jgi:hypothetical protein
MNAHVTVGSAGPEGETNAQPAWTGVDGRVNELDDFPPLVFRSQENSGKSGKFQGEYQAAIRLIASLRMSARRRQGLEKPSARSGPKGVTRRGF